MAPTIFGGSGNRATLGNRLDWGQGKQAGCIRGILGGFGTPLSFWGSTPASFLAPARRNFTRGSRETGLFDAGEQKSPVPFGKTFRLVLI